MVADVILKFCLIAMERSSRRPQVWDLEVLSVEEVADILMSLNFLDPESAALLTTASTTITPQPGSNTIPLADLAIMKSLFIPKQDRQAWKHSNTIYSPRKAKQQKKL